MSGIKIIADTNTIIYHLSGNRDVEALFEDNTVFISSITYTELLSSPGLDTEEEKTLKLYLASLQIVHTNEFICEIAGGLRRGLKLKLPDAIIAATCFYLDLPLITFDNDFGKIKDLRVIKLTL